MKTVKMNLTDLVKPERNVRVHTEQQLKEFERSVRMFGQLRPIVVDEGNVILCGNGLYETMVRMGETQADVLKLTDLNDHQKKKLMIADNKIFSLGIENMDTFNAFLNELRDDLDIPGYDSELLSQMVADESGVTEQLSSYGTISPEEAQNIREQQDRREQRQGAAQEQAPETAQEENGQEEQEDGRPFVICPNCGTKIWL